MQYNFKLHLLSLLFVAWDFIHGLGCGHTSLLRAWPVEKDKPPLIHDAEYNMT